MLKKIDINALGIGMYVVLPLAWYEHTFLKNHFKIVSEKQIDKIKETGLTVVTIDTAQGRDVTREAPPLSSPKAPPSSEKIIPDLLYEAINNKSLPPADKATAVHKQTLVMMHRLMENPSSENIQETKKGIAQIVNLILTDDTTNLHLLQITSHDHYTYTHSLAVGLLSISLAKVLFKRSDGHDMHELGAGFFLHDLGKVKIDTAIINKPGKLTDEEMQQMKRHPQLGFTILRNTKQLSEECKLIVLQHHERNDGTGYPKGMRGDAIHIYGRICSMADVYDALTSERPYRQPLSPFAALKLMKDEMLNHFHQDLFEKFVLLVK